MKRFVIAGLIALAPLNATAQTGLLKVSEVVLPMEESNRKGGVVPLGYTNVETDQANGAVRVQGEAGKQLAFGRWFPNHLPITAKELADPALRLQVVLKGAEPVQVQAAWRFKGDQGIGATVEGFTADRGDGSSTLMLPLPPIAEGQEPNAVFFYFPGSTSVEVQRAAVVLPVDMLLDVQFSMDPWKAAPVKISGRGATPGAVVQLAIRPEPAPAGNPLDLKVTAGNDGQFSVLVEAGKLIGGDYTVVAREGKRSAPAEKFFVFPVLTGKKLPPVSREGRNLMVEGKPLGFVGINYSPFHGGFAREPDFAEVVRNIMEMQRWGLRVCRVPVHFGVIQPAEGVFPDNPRWAEVMRKHNLDPQFMALLDYFVQLAGQVGIYSVMDWHGMPTLPYDYHVGGQPRDKEAGKPGEGVAWLSPSPMETVAFDPGNPRHRKALLDTHTWLAGHYKGNSNLLGIEVPYNEPHDLFMAVEINWRELTDLAAAAVQKGDPDRLTFTMPSAYGHDNLSPSATWLPIDRVTGGAPHFYLANGPVPVRPEAAKYRHPYLARDVNATFAHAQTSVFFPYTGVNYPIYNGESGEYGNQDFLADEVLPDRAEWIIEAQLVQAYASGLAGALDWTLWNHPTDFIPYREIYERVFKRYAPVFNGGPVDHRRAEVAIVQSPGAVPPQNGMNHACVPFAKLSLALHLPFVHYFSDQQFLYSFRASVPTGLEQVEEGVSLERYKALIVDRRNLDARALKLAETSGVPVLWTDDAEKITAKELAAFLAKQNVAIDTRTPEGLQVIEGPSHLVIYARYNQAFDTRAYPNVKRRGVFRLVDEAGKEVFRGDATKLATQGLQINTPRWRAVLLRFAE